MPASTARTSTSPACISASGWRCRACTTRRMPSIHTHSTWSSTCASRRAVADVRVAAGVLAGADGRVLLASRPPGKQLAGHCEFPGGRLEPAETSGEALRRELREELAIEAGAIDAEPLIEVPWRHDATRLRLI